MDTCAALHCDVCVRVMRPPVPTRGHVTREDKSETMAPYPMQVEPRGEPTSVLMHGGHVTSCAGSQPRRVDVGHGGRKWQLRYWWSLTVDAAFFISVVGRSHVSLQQTSVRGAERKEH